MTTTGKPRRRGKNESSTDVSSTRGGNDDGGDESPSERLSTLLGQFGAGDDYRAYVERLHQGAEPEYLGPVPFGVDFYDSVRDRWGGGRFAARIVDGQSRYKGRVPPFRIAGKPRDDQPEPARPIAVVRDEQPSRLETILGEALAGIRAAVESMRQQPAAPAADPVATAVSIIKAVREATPAPLPPQPAPDAAGMLETMNAVLEMQERLAERTRPAASGVADAIREFAPMFAGAMNRHDAETPSPDPMLRRGTIQKPAQAPPAVAAWVRPFLGWKRQLLALADAGRDPALYASVVNDAIDEATAAALAAAIEAETITNDLFTAFPELMHSAERRVFAGKLIEGLKELFVDDDEPAAETPANAEAAP